MRTFRPGAADIGTMPGGMGGPRMGMRQPMGGMDARTRMLRMLLSRGIQSYAQGGVVDEPTLAMIGDDGPEAVVPLSNTSSNPNVISGQDYYNSPNQRRLRESPEGIIKSLLSNRSALGPDYLRGKVRRGALQSAQGGRRRSDVLSRLYGLDPMQQRQAAVDAEIGASSDVSGALNRADLAGAGGYQDFLRRLLTGERGFQQELTLQERREAEARAAEDRNRQDFWGQLIGQGAGALFGG